MPAAMLFASDCSLAPPSLLEGSVVAGRLGGTGARAVMILASDSACRRHLCHIAITPQISTLCLKRSHLSHLCMLYTCVSRGQTGTGSPQNSFRRGEEHLVARGRDSCRLQGVSWRQQTSFSTARRPCCLQVKLHSAGTQQQAAIHPPTHQAGRTGGVSN